MKHHPHIGIYGRTNAGKSTLLNRLTGQDAAIVAPEPGTTTDPVRRSFEIEGFGPVVLVDTAGIDDTSSELGRQRVARTLATLDEVDAAVVLLSGEEPDAGEQTLLQAAGAAAVPCLLLRRSEIRGTDPVASPGSKESANHARNAGDKAFDPAPILRRIAGIIPADALEAPPFFGGRVTRGDTVVLVCPVDSGAPAGRLILPQVQALRAALDTGAVALAVKPSELRHALSNGGARPKLVVTDSQVFPEVQAILQSVYPPQPDGSAPELTSFSILLAEMKGDPGLFSAGLAATDRLHPGDRVLIVESCSHQVSCDDIGRVKIPAWLTEYAGMPLGFVFVSGRDPLPDDLSQFALAVHCGSCMTTRRVVQARLRLLSAAGVPVTNYGMLIKKIRSSGNP